MIYLFFSLQQCKLPLWELVPQTLHWQYHHHCLHHQSLTELLMLPLVYEYLTSKIENSMIQNSSLEQLNTSFATDLELHVFSRSQMIDK